MSMYNFKQSIKDARITIDITEKYLEKHYWFNYYSTDALMAKYWAAEEIAKDVYASVHDTDKGYFGWQPRVFSHLVQILKKEWFR